MVKRKDLEKILLSEGFINKHGGKHDKFVHEDGRQVIVPRSREIKDFTAKTILKEMERKHG